MQRYQDSLLSQDASLPSDAWAQLAQSGHIQKIERGRIIYLQGQEPQYLYYLVQGRVRAFLVSDEGVERVLAVYPAGSIFGEASFFDGLPRVSSAIAVTDCQIVSVDRPTVMQIFSQHPALALDMLQYISRTVRMLSDTVDHMSFLSADKRIIRLLLAFCQKDGVVAMSQDEIAVGVGVSRVTVNRVLRELGAQGYLQTAYGCVRLLQRELLEQRAK